MRASLGLTLLLFACGSESVAPAPVEASEEEPAPPSEEPEAEETSAPETAAAYAIHEWGFIAHHYAEDASELLTSGTAPAPEYVPVQHVPGQLPPGHHSTGRAGGKPVIYVHLQGEGDGDVARFTASLSTSGRFVEEWPHSEGSTPTNLTWDVEARRGSCSARDDYPVAGSLHCLGIADRYCEAAELAHYETEDSACLTVNGEEWNHLFYRAQIPGEVPLRVSKRGNTFTVHSSGALPGRLMRIRRGDDATETRVTIFDAPADGASTTLPTPDEPAATGIAALESELSALGMSEDESAAFMIAWQAELFGDTPERAQVEMVGSPPHDLRPKGDALIYFLPTATLDAMVPLAFTPPPAEVRRAVLVRIDLGEAPPHADGTLRIENLDALEALRADGQTGYGNGVQPPGEQLPSFRLGRTVVEGPLDLDVVRRVIRRHFRVLRECGQPGVETDAALLLTIRAAGAVQSVEVNNAPPEMASCLENVAKRWTFPASVTGTTEVVAILRYLHAR